MSVPPDLVATLAPVAATLDRLGVEWYVGGSVASSAQGVARLTLDIDVVADLRPEHAAPIAAALETDYYVDAESISEALGQRSSFNVIHLGTGMKVDVFVRKATPYAREAARRRVAEDFGSPPAGFRAWFSSPEDTVLAKLAWYRAGREISERQWRDVLGVLRVQGAAIDRGYMARWAPELGVADLLERALAAARDV
jgi:hypothetical protein